MGIEAGEDLVDEESHEGVGPVSSVDLVVSNNAESLSDVVLRSRDGEGGATELGELGDDVEGGESLEEDTIAVVLSVHGRSPVVQESLGSSIDREKRAAGEDGGTRREVQDESTLLVQHGGQDSASDEQGGLNVDAARVADEGVVNQVEVLGMGVANTNVVDEETDVLSFQGSAQTLVVSRSSIREVNANRLSLTLSAYNVHKEGQRRLV